MFCYQCNEGVQVVLLPGNILHHGQSLACFVSISFKLINRIYFCVSWFMNFIFLLSNVGFW